MSILTGLHRCAIDSLDLTTEQWKVLMDFLQHNLHNGLGGLGAMIFYLEQGTPEKIKLDYAQGTYDRVVAVIDTLEELRRKT